MVSSKMCENLENDEKIRLFEGQGSWNTFDSDGKLNSITMSDGPHGLRRQKESNVSNINESNIATCFPTASAIASTWNTQALNTMGKAIALEAQSENVNLVLGPGMNIKRSPLCGRNFEYFSEDPYLSGKLAAAYVNGMQEGGVGACVKHFACNSQEKRRQTSSSIIDERTLHEIYLRAYEIVVKTAKPAAIMASYNKINGVYACQNKMLLTEILRKKWGYKGFVVSDWGACINPAKCLKAGLDLAMPDSHGYFGSLLNKALEEGEITEKDLDTANKRVLTAVNQLTESHTDLRIDYIQQHETALALAEESIVLLRNKGILPVKSDRVVIIGEFAKTMRIQGAGSSHVHTREYPNVIQALENMGVDVFYEPDIKNAVNQVRLAAYKNIPVLFFCGLPDEAEGEGFDRKDLKLPKEQIKILKQICEITDNVVVFNTSGSPVDLSFIGKVKGLVQLYLCGEASGQACANIIMGKANPSGHLAETFPVKIEDTLCYGNFGLDSNSVPYKEGVFTGYRYYETYKVPVAYEFGKGLSYTKFEYTDLKVKLPKVSFKITNTGDYDGAEVPQIYIKNPQISDVRPVHQVRPVKELAGFDKVFLKTGETKTVEITLDDKAFCVYDVKASDFVKIGGDYEIQVGSSIKDIRLKQEVSVTGPDVEDIIPKDALKDFFANTHYEDTHKTGEYTIEDNFLDLSKGSIFVRLFKCFFCLIVRLQNKGKSKKDPSVMIAINGIKENPVASLISMSGGKIKPGFVHFLVNAANKTYIKKIAGLFKKNKKDEE